MVSFKQKTTSIGGHFIVTITLVFFGLFWFAFCDKKHSPGLLVLTCYNIILFNVGSSGATFIES